MTITVNGVEDLGAKTLYVPGDPNGIYDLTSTGDLVIQGQLWLQDSLANDTFIGVHTEGSAGTPTLDIVHGGGEIDVMVLGSGSSAYGFYSGSAPASFTDDWAFTVNAPGTATGVVLGAGGAFQNTDEFAVMSGTGIATGVFSAAATAISNSGFVQVTSSATDAYGFDLTHFGGSTLTNGGNITIYAYAGTGYGIALADPAGGTATVVNTGTINAKVAIQVDGTLSLALTNSGSIVGAIALGAGSGNTINNTGFIGGSVTLSQSGTDTYDGHSGTLNGRIVLGGGADTVFLGGDGETAYGGAGNDTVVGGAGADFIVAGTGTDTLTGGGGADTFVFRTPSGRVTITDFSDAGHDKLNLSALGFNSLASVLADAAQVGANTVITDGGLTITLDNVTATALQASDFVFGTIKVSATENFVIDPSVTISATSGPLVDFTGNTGGTLTNRGSMTLTATSATASGVTTDISPDPTALFVNDGSLNVAAQGASGVVNATLRNNGTFTVTSNVFYATGAMGDVVNAGSMTVQGGPLATTYGVNDWDAGNGLGTFSNLAKARLSVTSTAGSAVGVALVYGSGFENDGSILVSAATSADGLDYTVGGLTNLIVNTGAITATAASSVGISIATEVPTGPGGAPATLENSGTITAQLGVEIGNLNADVINTGVINGAVELGSGTNTLDSHAGTINGVVSLGTGSNTVTLGGEDNTVLLAAGTHVVDGGGGTNTASYVNAASGVTVSLALQGTAQNTIGAGTDTLSNFQNLTGSAFNDTLEGDANNNVLDGGGGINTVSYGHAAAGVNVSLALQGQAQNTIGVGTDTLSNFENIIGSKYDDSLTGDANNNVIDGGGGSDVLNGGGGVNTVSFASATTGVTVSLALQGQAQTTGVGNDTLTNFQNLTGSAFNDTLEGDANNNVLDGGGGINTVSYGHAAAGVNVSLALQGQAQNTIGAGTDTLSNFENIIGSKYDDTLTGDANNNIIDGGAGGNKVLDGGGGVNTVSFASIPLTDFVIHLAYISYVGVNVSLALQGQAQNTGWGTDTLSNFQNIIGSPANDTLEGDSGNNVLDGGGGTNTVSYAHATAGVAVSLSLQGQPQNTIGAGIDTLSNFQNLIGSAFNDTLSGDAGGNVIDGGGGVNTLSYAWAPQGVQISLSLQGQVQDNSIGDDTLSNFQNIIGSAYNDTLEGDSGNNVLDGGGGVNTVSYAHATAGVVVNLELQGQAQNTIGAGTDTLSNFQILIGSDYNDTLTGAANTNAIYGGDGNDQIIVKAGEFHAGEILDGGAGTNTLVTVGSIDLTGGSLANFQALTFSNPGGAAVTDTISATQASGYYGSPIVASSFSPSVTVTGGAGADTLVINPTGASLDLSHWTFVNWSAGDTVVINGSSTFDYITLNTLSGNYQVNLGTGVETLTLAPAGGPFLADDQIVVTGFEAGVGGDKLVLGAYLNSVLQGYTGSDPFAGGYIRLLQSGSDTLVQIDPAGGATSFSTLMTLKGVDAYALTSVNLGGFTSNVAPANTQVAPAGSNVLLTAGSGDQLLIGANGANDTFQGGSGADHLVGGSGGVNTALFTGLYRGYTVATPTTGADGVSGGLEGGVDALTNIQRIQFADGYVATSTTDTAGEVYRLYEATLGRAPDPVGLSNWVHILNSGAETLQQVVDGFVGSTEFQALYGALNDAQFVTLLYNNVLGRAPDAAGLANWVGLLNAGTDTRAQVVLGFSQSTEDIAALAAPVQQGLWVQDPGAAEVARLYDTVLGRLPDQAGEIGWVQALDSGAQTLLQVTQGFVGSAEFQAVYGALNNTQFVTQLYENTLHRAPDAAGLASWVNALNAGTDSRAQVVLGFSESPEHIANLAPHIDQGIWFA